MNAAGPVGEGAGCHVLAIMGSGETSPTMVGVHKALLARLGPDPAAVVLDTPYAFQENAGEVSAKARTYFGRSVGLTINVLSTGGQGDGEVAAMRAADWLFAGPGSPSYALSRWCGGPAAGVLRERVGGGQGITLLASAAAATMGLAAVPVYEIYKAGAPPHWLDGLDLMGLLGLKVAVIPHFNNTEGGTHDTRYCYLGEKRLAVMERDLPADAAVLGVDEHTAAVIDLREQTMTVAGRGTVTVRRLGQASVLPVGTVVTLGQLRGLVQGAALAFPPAAARPGVPGAARDQAAGPGPAPMPWAATVRRAAPRPVTRSRCPSSPRTAPAGSRRPPAGATRSAWPPSSSTSRRRSTPGRRTPTRTRAPGRPVWSCAA